MLHAQVRHQILLRECEARFERGVVGGGFRVVVSGRGRIQPCATPVRFRNIAANLAPQNELLKPARFLPTNSRWPLSRCFVASWKRVNRLFTESASLSLSRVQTISSSAPRFGHGKITPDERCVCAWTHVWVSAACFKNLISRLWCWISGISFFFFLFFTQDQPRESSY